MACGLGHFASPVPVVVLLCVVPIWELSMSGELADAAAVQGTQLPLTKQKTVRCYKENIKKDDGKNFEIEKIRKNEDVIETLQQRRSRDTNCVVTTSVTDDSPESKLQEYSGGSADIDMDIDMAQFGGGGADISLGQDFDPPHLDAGYGSMHVPPSLDIPSIPSIPSMPSVSTDFGNLHSTPKLRVPGHSPPFGGGKTGIDSGFGNLQDINTFHTGSTSDGAAPVEENVKTYEFATNVKRQESYDHHGFHQERSRVAAPGGGWRTTFRHDGPGGATYETSANDLDHKISAVNGAGAGAGAGCGRALYLALLLLLPRVLLHPLR